MYYDAFLQFHSVGSLPTYDTQYQESSIQSGKENAVSQNDIDRSGSALLIMQPTNCLFAMLNLVESDING